LKYCLRWLRWANEHIAKVIGALKSALKQFEKTGDRQPTSSGLPDEMEARGIGAQDRGEIAERIAAMKGDVLKTLRDVIDTVSKYAGGALPENARVLVRRHLTSLPQRFRLASQTEASASASGQAPSDKEMQEGTQRILLLAKEGLDMIAQVSGVLDGTIVSAEEWCERLGKKKRDEREQLAAPPAGPLTAVAVDPDVEMK